MKERRFVRLLLLLAVFLFGLTALAEEYSGGEDWQVVLEANGRMRSNFSSSDVDKILDAMEPGDTAVFRVSIRNAGGSSAAWCLSNEILYSLEDRSDKAWGGAYEYLLVYSGGGKAEKVLFSSESVGGEGSELIPAGEGLHGADSALKDFFYLDDLAPGESGTVTIRLTLDGESQGNSYQNTKADVQLRFAAEIKRPDGSSVIVDTGEAPTLWIWSAVMLVSGGLLLFLLIRGRKKRREEEIEE